YQLAQWTDSADCDSYWEDHNRVVIARGPSYNETLIETLTDEHIDLNICQHHLRHRTDCLETEWVVDCRVNCSFFKLDDCPPTTIAALLLVLIIWWAISKYKQRKSAAAPPEQVQIQPILVKNSD
ncbi:hypothetical protein ILYODFUR_028097, partial [Ilyodon furcidens]